MAVTGLALACVRTLCVVRPCWALTLPYYLYPPSNPWSSPRPPPLHPVHLERGAVEREPVLHSTFLRKTTYMAFLRILVLYLVRHSRIVSQPDVACLLSHLLSVATTGFQTLETSPPERKNTSRHKHPLDNSNPPAALHKSLRLRGKGRDQLVAVTRELIERGRPRKRTRAVCLCLNVPAAVVHT